MDRASWLVVLLAACGGDRSDVAVLGAPAPESPEVAWARFGAEVSAPERIVAAADLLADPAPRLGQSVVVDGRIADVCQTAGCWMVLTDGDKLMRIRMKDHAFSVPKDTGGKPTRVFGTVVRKDIHPKMVEHFRSESTRPEAMPETQAGTTATYELIADAVWVQG